MCAAACPKGSVVPLHVLTMRARVMLAHPTVSESALWAQIRGGRLGARFIRQAPLAGRYVVDFLAPEFSLAVEVDGAYHRGQRRADARRDEWLRRAGYRVLRLEAEVVEHELPVAVERIRAALAARGCIAG
jgi:very-short-patch-repair endonuclease